MTEYYPSKTQQLVEMLADLKDASLIIERQQERIVNTVANIGYMMPDLLAGTEDYEAFKEAYDERK